MNPGGQRNFNIISNIIACLHNNILCPLGETINQCIGPFSGNSGGGSLKKKGVLIRSPPVHCLKAKPTGHGVR